MARSPCIFLHPPLCLVISAHSQSTYLEPFDLITSKSFSEGLLSPKRQGSNESIIRNRQRTRAPMISQRVKTISLIRCFLKTSVKVASPSSQPIWVRRGSGLPFCPVNSLHVNDHRKKMQQQLLQCVIWHSMFPRSYKRYYRCLASAIIQCLDTNIHYCIVVFNEWVVQFALCFPTGV